MLGIVLGVEILTVLLFYWRRNKKIIHTVGVQICIIVISLILIGFCIYRGVNDYSYLYVGTSTSDEFISHRVDKKENEKREEVKKYSKENNNKGNESINIEDFIKEVVVSILITVMSLIIYKSSILRKYCKKLKKELYSMNHTWLNGKSLKNIMVSINVWQDHNFVSFDICEYFKEKFEKEKSDFYIILGNPGEGKTISIRKIADIILDRKKSGGHKLIPIMLDFIELVNISNDEALYEYMRNHIYSLAKSKHILNRFEKIRKKIDKIIYKQMEQGKFVFLIDGYDEVNEEARYQLSKVLETFKENFSKCFFIITSRVAIFENDSRLNVKKENILHLVPFSQDKIRVFLEKWGFPEEKDYWKLYEKIIDNYQLERLARNPLLLTLIAYLFDTSKLKIPNSIAQFYDEGTKCLLENWENEKRILKRMNIDYEIKCVFLENMAKLILDSNQSVLTEKIIMEKLSVNGVFRHGVALGEVLKEIYLYSGILERTKEGYKFYHRSFYEFFLAKYYIKNGIEGDVLTWEKQHYQILFFYFSLIEDGEMREKYIEKNINNFAVIEPLLIECEINNKDIILKYLNKKKKNYRRSSQYYQILGNIAEKYEYVQDEIYVFLIDELQKSFINKNDDKYIYIIRALSYFLNNDILVKIIEKNIDNIKINRLIEDSTMGLEKCILELFHCDIDKDYKIQILESLIVIRKFESILSILKEARNEEEKEIVFWVFIHQTKNPFFIQWYGKQNVLVYENVDTVDLIEEWAREFGWKWDNIESEEIKQKYLLTYYLIKLTDKYNLKLSLISSRIKFLGSYIKNEYYNDKLSSCYVDISGYNIASIVEFKYHWKKTRIVERLKYDPVIIKYIEWFIGLVFMIGLMFMVLWYKNQYDLEEMNIGNIIYYYLYEKADSFRYISKGLKISREYNLEISRYTIINSNVFIFYLSWIFLQLKTYKYLLNKPHNRMYTMLYFMIFMVYIAEYFLIFQDIMFRLAAMFVSFIILLLSRLQYKYNMPSFREPQYNKIRRYLEEDLF